MGKIEGKDWTTQCGFDAQEKNDVGLCSQEDCCRTAREVGQGKVRKENCVTVLATADLPHPGFETGSGHSSLRRVKA
jgi:hypothetical protein